MDDEKAKLLLDEIVGQVFGYQNPLNLEQAMTKFAFDIRLPQEVFDSISGEATWAASIRQSRYLTSSNVKKRVEQNEGMRQKRDLNTIDDVLGAWQEINYATAAREIDSANVANSDGVYHSDTVYRSTDIRKSKNVLFSDGVDGCNYVVAGQTSKACEYSIRVEDSKNVKSSFNIVWSNKISNSFFVQDCYELEDCMFCTHLSNKKFCIANIQFEEQEYRRIKDIVVRWILQS